MAVRRLRRKREGRLRGEQRISWSVRGGLFAGVVIGWSCSYRGRNSRLVTRVPAGTPLNLTRIRRTDERWISLGLDQTSRVVGERIIVKISIGN